MRIIGIFVCWLVLLAGPAAAQRPVEASNLAAFAHEFGLHDVDRFVETVRSLRDTGRLPAAYVTKEAARAHGWHGGGLCEAWPGQVIGGDVFRNFGRSLPDASRRVYREADLDATCRSRGPKRLIFSNDGLIFVTIDHYNSFVPVP